MGPAFGVLTLPKDGLPVPASEYSLTISKSASLDAVKKAVRSRAFAT